MATTNDGGPAFPVKLPYQSAAGPMTQQEPGLSLRDYFAGQALTGICADPSYPWHSKDAAAEVCYEVADAMLRAREKGGE